MEILLVVGFVLFLILGAYLRSPTVVGTRGENRVNRYLCRKLPDSHYTIYHDITLPSSRGETQIDHVVLSPYGVFVIETKNYSGWIFGNAKSSHWTQVIYKKKHRFMNPLRQNYKHTKAVESFFRLGTREVHSVVTFVGESKFKTELPSNVTTLRQLAPYIISKQDWLIDQGRLEEMNKQLQDFKNGRGVEPTPLSVVDSEPACPKCGTTMVKRTAKRGKNAGNEFWGCPSFPTCRGVRQI